MIELSSGAVNIVTKRKKNSECYSEKQNKYIFSNIVGRENGSHDWSLPSFSVSVTAFEMVRHKQLFEQKGKLDLLGNYIRITHNLYLEQTTRVKIEKVFSI